MGKRAEESIFFKKKIEHKWPITILKHVQYPQAAGKFN